jgi:hypothetical protein
MEKIIDGEGLVYFGRTVDIEVKHEVRGRAGTGTNRTRSRGV